MEPERERKRVLITGAAGRIGQGIRPCLRRRYDLLLMCHLKGIEPEDGEEVVAGNVLDLQSMAAAMIDVDAVVHHWDITNAQLALGYAPEDNAETCASQLLK